MDDPERDPLFKAIVWVVAAVLLFLLLSRVGISVRIEFGQRAETQAERDVREMNEFVRQIEEQSDEHRTI